MPQLDERIDQWVDALGTAEPALRPHLDEIGDHVRSDARARVRAGADPSSAFAAAITAFGAPRNLAIEFVKSEPSEERLALNFVALYLIVTLLVTATFIGIDKLVLPLDPTWFGLVWMFVLNPLIMLPFIVRYLRVRSRLRTARSGG